MNDITSIFMTLESYTDFQVYAAHEIIYIECPLKDISRNVYRILRKLGCFLDREADEGFYILL